MMRKVRDQPSTTQEELVNDLKAVGTTVTKRTISNTLHLSISMFFQSCLSLLSESFSVSSTYVSHWLDHYVFNACIDLINSPRPT